MRWSENVPAVYIHLILKEQAATNQSNHTNSIKNARALASKKNTAIYPNETNMLIKTVSVSEMHQNDFSIVWSSPETSVTSLPVLVIASDIFDIFITLLYNAALTHLFMFEAKSLEYSTNTFLTSNEINKFAKNMALLHIPSAASSPL